MLDTKLSCLLRGIVGVIFGFLALMVPEFILGTFSGLFFIMIGLGMALFLFIAITSRSEEAMLWFGLAAVLLVIGVISFVFSQFVAILFILIIAGIAVYNGFNDITLALAHPKTKFILIPAMIISGIVILCLLFYYFPGFEKYLYLSVVGTFALVFGLFSIFLGYYKPDNPAEANPLAPRTASCTFGKEKENK
ncbi:hypothetical protein [uncultured Methanoregula sp.]|uniref:hypothetical protein n=1 Tax=uncultured Methanoregula sp. TaxID=1005933 RepID=UPI002AABA0F4|nr:hypothetical protein [uncultured Methanoregula sp.]